MFIVHYLLCVSHKASSQRSDLCIFTRSRFFFTIKPDPSLLRTRPSATPYFRSEFRSRTNVLVVLYCTSTTTVYSLYVRRAHHLYYISGPRRIVRGCYVLYWYGTVLSPVLLTAGKLSAAPLSFYFLLNRSPDEPPSSLLYYSIVPIPCPSRERAHLNIEL